jgi:hypothetical protein
MSPSCQAGRRELRQRRIQARIAAPKTPHGSGLGGERWVVERSLSWLHQYRRLRIRYERRADIQESLPRDRLQPDLPQAPPPEERILKGALTCKRRQAAADDLVLELVVPQQAAAAILTGAEAGSGASRLGRRSVHATVTASTPGACA